MRGSEIDQYGHIRLRAITSNSGTWRVKYGLYETIYHVSESELLILENHNSPFHSL